MPNTPTATDAARRVGNPFSELPVTVRGREAKLIALFASLE
jgi:hypothetical protein